MRRTLRRPSRSADTGDRAHGGPDTFRPRRARRRCECGWHGVPSTGLARFSGAYGPVDICNPYARAYAKAFAIMGARFRMDAPLCCIIARALRRFSYTGFLPLGLLRGYFDADRRPVACASARARKIDRAGEMTVQDFYFSAFTAVFDLCEGATAGFATLQHGQDQANRSGADNETAAEIPLKQGLGRFDKAPADTVTMRRAVGKSYDPRITSRQSVYRDCKSSLDVKSTGTGLGDSSGESIQYF